MCYGFERCRERVDVSDEVRLIGTNDATCREDDGVHNGGHALRFLQVVHRSEVSTAPTKHPAIASKNKAGGRLNFHVFEPTRGGNESRPGRNHSLPRRDAVTET